MVRASPHKKTLDWLRWSRSWTPSSSPLFLVPATCPLGLRLQLQLDLHLQLQQSTPTARYPCTYFLVFPGRYGMSGT